MKDETIVVQAGTKNLDCDTVILVGAMAIEQDGHITLLSRNIGSQTKHEFYALAQMALIQFQDKELEVNPVEGPIVVAGKNENRQIASGMAICRTGAGELFVFAHGDQPSRRLLDAANRYCTRWVRLDI